MMFNSNNGNDDDNNDHNNDTNNYITNNDNNRAPTATAKGSGRPRRLRLRLHEYPRLLNDQGVGAPGNKMISLASTLYPRPGTLNPPWEATGSTSCTRLWVGAPGIISGKSSERHAEGARPPRKRTYISVTLGLLSQSRS